MSKVAIKGADTGTGVFTIESPATNTDRTLTLPDESGELVTSVTSLPSGQLFRATQASTTTLSHNTFTKVAYATEVYDPSNEYDTTLSRYTPQVAGYYQVTGSILFADALTTASSINWRLYVYKNGAAYDLIDVSYAFNTTSLHNLAASTVVYLNGSTDYVELYAYQNDSNNRSSGDSGYFEAHLISR